VNSLGPCGPMLVATAAYSQLSMHGSNALFGFSTWLG
jgi:hypothetical protein